MLKRRDHDRSPRAGAPSQRQLRVGEELRHALAQLLRPGELRDPALHDANITVTEVRISPDLKNATAFVMPLAGANSEEIMAGLKRSAPFLKARVARTVELRQVPNISFAFDTAFDGAARIAALLHAPEVERDLQPPTEGDDKNGESGLHGWLIIDKPAGMTSARVVAAVKRASGAKVGHAGTLDPLATGVLPLALGEATKTVQFATAGRKRYRFGVSWGAATDTDDREGEVVAETPARPDAPAIAAALPAFIGRILQRPPAYSAIKVAGRRAYALARAGMPPELAVRPVEITALRLLSVPDPDHAEFEAEVGEGTYIRSLARDLAAALGTLGHIAELRRLSVGRFTEALAISLDSAVALGHKLAASEYLLPIETALDDIPALALTAAEASRLRHGQRIPVHDRFDEGTLVAARHDRLLVALARIEDGGLRPVRVINR